MSFTYKEASDMLDKHQKAYEMLTQFFGTDEKGRRELELFIEIQAELLPKEGDHL